MLRGASANQSNLSGGTLGASASSAPGIPKAAVDSDLVSMFDSSAGYSFDSTIASSEMFEPISNGDTTSSSVCQWSIGAQSTQGLYYDLSKSFIEVHFSGSDPSGTYSNVQPYLRSCLFFDRQTVRLNGVAIENQGDDCFNALAQVSLQQPYLPVDGLTQSALFTNIPQRHADMGYGSVNTFIGHPYLALPHDASNGQPIRHINIDNRAGDCITKIPLYNPLFCEMTSGLIPASYNFELECSKKGGAAFPFALRQVSANGGVNDAVYAPTIAAVKLHMCRVQLTSAGSSMMQRLYAETGRLVIPVLRCQHVQQFIPSGSTSVQALSVSARMPQAIMIIFTQSSAADATTKDSWLFQSEAGYESTGAKFPISSLKVRAGNKTYPQYQGEEITRNSTGRRNWGGTSLLDYETYSKLCYQHGQKPYWSKDTLDNGSIQIYFISLQPKCESLENHKPPVSLSGQVSVEATFSSSTSTAGDIHLVNLYRDTVSLLPALGSVQKSF